MFLKVLILIFVLNPSLWAATTVDGLTDVPESQVEGAPKPAVPSKPLINQAADYLSSSQEGISDRVIILANEVDTLFGNTRALDEYYESTLRVDQKSYVNSIGKSSYDIQTNLDLILPNWKHTEEKIQRWWSGDDKNDQKVTRKEFKELNPWEVTHGVGVRLARPMAYNARWRGSRNFLTGNVVHHFYEQLSWDSDRLWEEVTSLTSDYALNRNLLLRFVNEADWGVSDRYFNTFHGPSLIYTISKGSLTSFDARVITTTERNLLYTDNYTTSITYRSSLHPLDWMFIQITPELSWPRLQHFTAVWTLYVNLEIVFGSKKNNNN